MAVGRNHDVQHAGSGTPGDLIYGITGVTSEETISLPWQSMSLLNWKIQAWDATNGANSDISFTSTGLQWTWAFAGVLETYNLTDCTQFPASGKTVFNYSSVYHGYPQYVLDETPWVPKYYSYGGPGCGFDATVSGETGTLAY
jgi:hypothetical protein